MIRPAQPHDAEAIAELWNYWIENSTATFTVQLKTEQQIADLIQTAPVFCAFGSECLQGFASYGPFRKGPGYADAAEHSIYLSHTVQGQGVGCSLLSTLENHAKSQAIKHFVAGISGANAPGLRFHARQGYEQVGSLPRVAQKFGKRLDLIFMMKAL